MIVVVSESGSVEIQDASDLKGLAIRRCGSADVTSSLAAAGLGGSPAEGDHDWLSIEALRALCAPEAADSEWDEQCSKMIDFASMHGWTTIDERLVKAHVTLE
ncbi:hypothetical protein [Salinibacterium sp. ZJ454]|uniref:hypothetical protein n=1 Tax=Salinibacterium sp. ZJ454 TaxID=2708339 RepID=UPI00142262E8|nr:hypothetical protein [Salinibacterium sp. ZJ454]